MCIRDSLYAVEEADFVYLQRECAFTQGNLSSHLSKLEEAHYLTISKTFKGKYPLTLCRLTRKGRQAFEGYSATLRCVTEGLASGKP